MTAWEPRCSFFQRISQMWVPLVKPFLALTTSVVLELLSLTACLQRTQTAGIYQSQQRSEIIHAWDILIM